ncbi:hypothetical protein ACIPJ2_05220 [Curtobacterium sp. NPDC090217]|uniref:hypothetical protein n=1 Tax=Curtobacterium sp. NPDC090217 TaxID=3363970 RepID=UPI0037FA8344
MGNARRRAAGIAVALAATATLLSGCTGNTTPDPTPSASTTPSTTPAPSTSTTPGPSTSTTPRSNSTITPVPGVDYDGGTVPDTCDGLITTSKWKDSFLRAPLNDPAIVGDPVEIPKSVFTPVLQPDGKRLYCVWRDPRADITNVTIAVQVVDSSKAFAVLQGLQGFQCEHLAEGYRCQRISTDNQYGVETGVTYFTRGDIAIHISQANVPTSGLLDDVMAHVF